MKAGREVRRFLACLCAAVMITGTVTGSAVPAAETTSAENVSSEAENGTDTSKIPGNQENSAGTESTADQDKDEKTSQSQEESPEQDEEEQNSAAREKNTKEDGNVSEEEKNQTGSAQNDTGMKAAAKDNRTEGANAADLSETKKEEGNTEEKQKNLVDGIPVDDEGLPTRGLLLNFDMEDEIGSLPAPTLFVRLNPCGNKAHNTQPDNYMSSALGCAEYVFERAEGETKYHIVDQYKREAGKANELKVHTTIPLKANNFVLTAIESYSDTEDLWHSFPLRPSDDKTERIFALVPLGLENDAFFGASDRYCFRYEAALADEQNWKMTDGSLLSGGYIVKGPGETEHQGSSLVRRTIHLKRRTGGREIRLDEQYRYFGEYGRVPDAGLLLSMDSLPEEGMPDELNLHISCPEKLQNGEGGFGFSPQSEYRTSELQKWKYQITKKGGMRALIEDLRDDGTGKYEIMKTKLLEISGDGMALDLNELAVEEGDLISVVPVTLDWESTMNSAYEGNGLIPVTHFFHFQYDLSCSKSTLSVTSPDGTKFRVLDERHVTGKDAVADDGDFLQRLSVSVKSSGEEGLCGLQKKSGLPNYGFIVRKAAGQDWSRSGPWVKVIPQKTSGETSVFYAAEWYRKNGSSYRCIHREIAEAVHSVTVKCAGGDTKKNAVLCVIRRIRYEGDSLDPKDTFTLGGSACEVRDSWDNIRYPQSGKDTLELYTGGAGRLNNASGTIKLRDCSVWNTADPSAWNKTPDEVLQNKETVLRGITFQVDISKETQRVRTVQPGNDISETALRKSGDGPDGLPAHSLVIVNRTQGECADDGVEYNVSLGMPVGLISYSAEKTAADGQKPSYTYQTQNGMQKASCHLYRQNKNGTWEQTEQHNASDWVNSGTGNFNRVDLQDTYSYGVHAHLMDNEAIVITPQTDYYEISYSVDMFSHSQYDVLPDLCQVPEGCTHLTRHYFKGTFSHDDTTTEPENAVLVVTTSLKNADTGEKDDAAELPKTKVKPLKVNLFDYDFGKEHDFVLGNQTQTFRFRYDPKNVKDTDVNMWHNGARTGILENKLDKNGLPVFRYSTPFENEGAGLFDGKDISKKVNGGTKKAYMDVDFDFIYDESDSSYSYNSALNAACFDEKTGHVREYDRTLGIDGWDAKGAGFFPFNNFSQKGVWGTELRKNKGTYLISKKDGIDYHFGLSTTQTFEIPKDGKVNGKNLKFHFSGDDDAWVFIDGQLVLDMGGIHEAVQGDIDFTDGTWCVTADQNSPWNKFGNDYTAPIVSRGLLSDKISGFPSQTKKIGGQEGYWSRGTRHTFSFFYLERGGTLSDLSMNFNLPAVEKTPEEPKNAFIRTGQGGICAMQYLGCALMLGAVMYIRKRHAGMS